MVQLTLAQLDARIILALERLEGKADTIRSGFVHDWSKMINLRDGFPFECDDDEANYITRPVDAKVIYKIMLRATPSSRCTHFIDAFACVGGDTLAAMWYFPRLHVHAIQLDEPRENHERFQRLTHNIATFNGLLPRRSGSAQAYGTNIKSFLLSHAAVMNQSILYLDPPWELGPPGSGISSLRDISHFLEDHVFSALTEKPPRVIVLKLPCGELDLRDWPFLHRNYMLSGQVQPRGKFCVRFFASKV
jgi:hypothetical protein